MKIFVYDATTQRVNGKKPTVTFCKNGSIRLNTGFCEALKITTGKAITFCQDVENPSDWYLYFDADSGFPFRYKEGQSLIGSHKILANKMIDFLNADSKTVVVPVATKPIQVNGRDFYALITKALNSK